MHLLTTKMLPSLPLLLFLLFSLLPSSHPKCDQSSLSLFSSNSSPPLISNITNCKTLPTLGFQFGWTLHNINQRGIALVDIVFSAISPSPTGWIAWGVNPGRNPSMVGTRAIIALGQPSGSPIVRTYNLTTYTKIGRRLENSTIEVGVDTVGSKYAAGINGRMTVWAHLRLPAGNGAYNVTRLNVVWQVGEGDGMVPLGHKLRLENFDSVATIDLTSGSEWNLGRGKKRSILRIVHGVLSAVAWGVLLPIGAMGARYLRTSPFKMKKWLYVHAPIQLSAYIIGVGAWGIGLSLVTHSAHYKVFMAHRIIGIFVFILATIQITSLWVKPGQVDGNRNNWKLFHHFVGYLLIALSIVNIFKGLSILRPPSVWKWRYVGIMVFLPSVAILFEIATWMKKPNNDRNGDKHNCDCESVGAKERDENKVRPSTTNQSSNPSLTTPEPHQGEPHPAGPMSPTSQPQQREPLNAIEEFHSAPPTTDL